MRRSSLVAITLLLVLAAGEARLRAPQFRLASRTTAPSGARIPAGHPRGWRRVFSDDFLGGRLDSRKWGTYSGQPGGDPGGWWDPSHVVVRDGVVRLQSYRDGRFNNRWVSGGMSSARGLKQAYGRYDVRFRMDRGRGIAGVLLLWPVADHWPPEIDFAEDGGGASSRRSMSATLHHGAANRIVQHSVHADFSRWHTMGVQWTPRRLVYTLDGRRWGGLTSSLVPSERMELDAQTQAGTRSDPYAPAPDARTPRHVDMVIDWVVAYAPARR